MGCICRRRRGCLVDVSCSMDRSLNEVTPDVGLGLYLLCFHSWRSRRILSSDCLGTMNLRDDGIGWSRSHNLALILSAFSLLFSKLSKIVGSHKGKIAGLRVGRVNQRIIYTCRLSKNVWAIFISHINLAFRWSVAWRTVPYLIQKIEAGYLLLVNGLDGRFLIRIVVCLVYLIPQVIHWISDSQSKLIFTLFLNNACRQPPRITWEVRHWYYTIMSQAWFSYIWSDG